MFKSPPKDDTVLVLSPEKVMSLPKPKRMEEVKVSFTFGHRSIRCKRIEYDD